jgi:predicted ATP-grasp superfamily ATP-dependent carboligase
LEIFEMKSVAEVPALLMMPHYVGTLATARDLARRGVDVVMASDRLLAPAFWSRYVHRRVQSPSVARGPSALVEWLCRYGRENPGAVLYPTSDDIAWVVARYSDRLRPYFHLYAPPPSTLRTLLDKSALYEACVKFGVPAPKTWFPESESELLSLYDDERPQLLKPRAQMFNPAGGKGEKILDREHARRTWRLYRSGRYAPGMLEEFPSLDLPLLQEYEPTGTQGTYSISGFVDPAGRVLGARASVKLLQTSRVGIGMCFVAAEVDATALNHIGELCRNVGYFGTFEVEFVRRDGVYLLIDFNPRYYGQMGFDIARGAPFPWLVHHAALGQTSGLERLVTDTVSADTPSLYQDRLALTWWLGVALASGHVDLREAARWRRMTDELAVQSIDPYRQSDDPVPALVAAAGMLWGPLRHPLSFVRVLCKSEAHQQPITRSA